MATQFHWVFPLDNRRDELKRARHKIGCLLKEKKERDLHTEWIEEQMEELREDNHFLRHAKEQCRKALVKETNRADYYLEQLEEVLQDREKEKKACMASKKSLKNQKQKLRNQLAVKREECSQLQEQLALAKQLSEWERENLEVVNEKCSQLELELQQEIYLCYDEEFKCSMIADKLERARECNENLEIELGNMSAEYHAQCINLDKAAAHITQLEEQIASLIAENDRLKDAEAAPFENTAVEVEDKEVTYSEPHSEPSKPCGVDIDANAATCPVESEAQCKDTEGAKSSQRMAQEVVVKLMPVFVGPAPQDSEDVPFSSSDTLPPSQQAEMVVQATKESAALTLPSTNWKIDFPCGIPADHAVPLTRKRRHSWHKLVVAPKRRSALIYRANSTIANYKQRPAILRVLTNCREIRDKNRLIAKLKEQVQFLSELHEKDEKGYMKVSVEFQQICEQFIPRDSEIDQLVINQLPQITTGQDCEYWLKVLQAVLGLSTAACSCRNWHCMFQHWLSGRGSGPPIWKTLFDVLENSDIKELQRIARFLKARLHEFMPWSRLEEDGRCIACGQLLPRSIQEEEDKIFISKEESTNPGD